MTFTTSFRRLLNPLSILCAAIVIVALAVLLVGQTASAEGQLADPVGAVDIIHPAFPMLDASGENVLTSQQPVSTMQTCGACHDTQFIVSHSFHSDAGLTGFGSLASDAKTHAWDQSTGAFGEWNPLTYRYLSPQDDARTDLTTADWIREFGARHVGGGPAQTSRGGKPLESLKPDSGNVEASVIDPETGEPVPWDWQQSGTVEMNCFLCHTNTPNNDARIAALEAGKFASASTATLLGKEIVTESTNGFAWTPAAFDAEGNIKPETLGIRDPANENCALCHGLVHSDARQPLVAGADCSLSEWSTATTGQIISPQKLYNSGMNLQGKEDLSRTWDVHTERVVGCVDCHHSLNNPIYFQQPDDARPDYLAFDPRRIDFSDYLEQPVHQFAKGETNGGVKVDGVDNTLRRCESCHNMDATHSWLPYKEQHMTALQCETCHIPKMYAPAIDTVDWTVLKTDGQPVTTCRGADTSSGLITGFTPILLPSQNTDGTTSLAPNNVVTAWYWIYGDPARPVPERDLKAAWLEDGQYPAEVVSVFDTSGDGTLSSQELVIDTVQKQGVIAGRLQALGLDNPRIAGEAQPYSISHDIAAGDYATRECSTCHTGDSRVGQPMALSSRIPGDVIPTLNTNIPNAHITRGPDGPMLSVDHIAPVGGSSGIYVFGHDSVWWIDWLGIALFLGTLLGVFAHGGLRVISARRMAAKAHTAGTEPVYIYGVYERLWHWLQTAAILLLIFTGLIIHKPDKFGVFAFETVVQVHNIVAALLVINALLSLFYHLASGEIRQYLPRPYGFFDDTIVQARYYLQGIFRGDPHPFEKTLRQKMNPLQQITYFGILNVLLPLQVLSGLLMWGAQQWPEIASRFGGLPWLAPAHTLIAWLFATFVVMHVYLTTTGHTPLANIRAMMLGWDDVEVHPHTTQGGASS